MVGVAMCLGSKVCRQIRDELAFVSYELAEIESELDGWNRADLDSYPDRARGAWRRERLGQAAATYAERKLALAALLEAQACAECPGRLLPSRPSNSIHPEPAMAVQPLYSLSKV